MITVLIVWIVLLFIFLAFGDAFIQFYNRITKNKSQLSVINTFYIGLSIAGIIACSLSLFIPLHKVTFLITLALTFSYWSFSWKRLINIAKDVRKRYLELPIGGKVLLILAAIIILYHSASPSASFDQSLYHIQHIKWLQEYGVVPGLANLHTRFGFNSSALSIFSLFTFHPDLKISFTALNGLCLLTFSTWLIRKVLRTKNAIKALIYTTTFVVFVHFYAMELSSTSTDIMVNILVAYLILNCFFSKDIKSLYILFALVPAFCVTLKLSSAPIIILSLFVFWILLKEKKTSAFAILFSTTALIAISWIAQNIVLTGYIVFPFPSIDLFSFDWKVPIEVAAHEKDFTYQWARGSLGTDSSLLGWLPYWFSDNPYLNRIIYILALVSIGLFLFTYKKLKNNTLQSIGCVIAITGTIFGFVTAPSLRFSLGFVLTTIFISILFLCDQEKLRLKAWIGLQYSLIVILLIFHINYITTKTIELVGMGSSYAKAQFLKPFPFSYVKRDTQFEKMRINNVELFIPVNKDQCYDCELPCAPKVPDNIELRGKDLSDGFRIKQDVE